MEQVRGILSFFQANSDECPSNKIQTIPHPEDECYNMQHNRKGYAIIFNNLETSKDAERISKLLSKLEFNVETFDNLNFEQIYQATKMVSRLNHSDADCFVMVFLAHGNEKGLNAADVKYNPNDLFNFFTARKCPMLIGKPKLFFIDGCRGPKIDTGIRAQYDTDTSIPTEIRIPNSIDFLIAYSTEQGHRGYASNDISWYIDALCNEIEKHHESKDLLSILTFVNRTVAFNYEGPKGNVLEGAKQTSTFLSTLTRYLYL